MAREDDKSARPWPLDRDATAQLRDDLVRVFLHRGAELALAEDLAQQVVLKVVAALDGFEQRSSLRTWARRIADNLWSDHLRRDAASPVNRAARGDSRAMDAVVHAAGDSAKAVSSEDEYAHASSRECLLAAVDKLPANDRRVLLLCEFGDMSVAEAAGALGCTAGAAKLRLHRARERLATLCRSDCEGESDPEAGVMCSPKTPRPHADRAAQAADDGGPDHGDGTDTGTEDPATGCPRCGRSG